jgi:hypothetical protein
LLSDAGLQFHFLTNPSIFMKKYSVYLGALLLSSCVQPQMQQSTALADNPTTTAISTISNAVEQAEIETHIRFLAADELAGRDVGTPGLDIAARYLTEYFRSWGLKPLQGLDGYRQEVPLRETKAPGSGQLTLGDRTFALKENFLLNQGSEGTLQGEALLFEYVQEAELRPEQVKGKWIISHAGKDKDASPLEQYNTMVARKDRLEELGAMGLIELKSMPKEDWSGLATAVSRIQGLERATAKDLAASSTMPVVWLHNAETNLYESLRKQTQSLVSLTIKDRLNHFIHSPNVLAMVEGSDPELKEEYVLLSAHYDHVGIGRPVAGDSIYNGARDNAIGAAALLMAARYFAKHPPKRSIILAAWTAEEKGLIGSRWFTEHPPLPLKQIVYNLNSDGWGYNDTTKVTIIGLERTEAEADLIAAAQAFGLEAIPDPVPEQNLFNRSDNFYFAKAGIPAITYEVGSTAFDDEIKRYYHQPADEAESLNFSYITRYIQSFIFAAETIANAPRAPFWTQGDEFEAASKELYGR